MRQSPPGGSLSHAILLVGVGHLAGWTITGRWFDSVVDVAVLSTGSGSTWLEVAVAAVLLIGSLLGGAWLAARAVARQRALQVAGLSLLAFAAGALVIILGNLGVMALTDTDGVWRPPMVGSGIGAQLAVVLPGAGLRAVVRRLAVPVAFDLVTTLVAEPNQYRGMIALLLALGWFVVGLLVVAESLTGLSTFTDDVAIQVREKPDGRSTEVTNLRDASQIITAEVTVQPGAVFPWHTHPGTALAIVADGADEGTAFEFMYDDCRTYAYEVGDAFVDPGFDNVHTAWNPSDEVTTVVVTFIGVKDASAGLTIPIDPDEAAALNAACDTNAPLPQD